MRTTKPIAVIALLFALLLATGALASQATTPAPLPSFLQPDPGFAELGALPEPLDAPSLERAAFLASGVPDDKSPAYEARLGPILERLADETATIADVSAKAEAILGFLHKSALRAYREDATTLDGILDSGLYNCVSSAVLYAIAARGLGIDVAGTKTRDHAFCTVLVGGGTVDVETTNPYGFNPGGKKEFKDSFGRVTGFAYVAPGSYGDRKAIGTRDLVGLILSNRASALERAGRFSDATRLGADYDVLCPGADARAFLVDRLNNLVADLEARRDYAAAEAAARAAAAALPGEGRLSALAKTASYNRAAALGMAGDWAASFEAAVVAAAASPDDRNAASLVTSALAGLAQDYARRGEFEAARSAIAERADRAGRAAAAAASAAVGEIELVKAANGLAFAQAAAAADRIFAAGEVGAALYSQAVTTIYGNEAGRIGSSGDWLKGAGLAEAGAALLARDAAKKAPEAGQAGRRLEELAQSLRHNYVAEAHNRFARLYNAKDFAGAKAALEAALEAMPQDATLKRDLAAATAALSR